jgi:hypothetical protein
MPRVLILVFAVTLLVSIEHLSGQTQDDDGSKGRKITFHVTSVRHEDDATVCQTGECSATKFTVEGYADGSHTGSRIEYVLTCDEYLAYKPKPHISLICGRVHANNNYDAMLYPDSIYFLNAPKPADSAMEANYEIESDKEVSNPSK